MLSQFIDLFDLYTFPFLLNFKRKQYYHSTFGGVMGCISIITFFLVSIIFVLDFFKRNYFSIIINESTSKTQQINFSDIPLMFAVGSSQGVVLPEDETLFKYDVTFYSFTSYTDEDGNLKSDTKFLHFPVEPCSENKNFINSE